MRRSRWPAALPATGMVVAIAAGGLWLGPPVSLAQQAEAAAGGRAALSPPPEPEPPAFEQFGKASWYGAYHQGRPTASGERFDMNQMTAAHRTLPLGTVARVTNLETGRSIEVTVNDRGPYRDGRVIDLSRRAAEELGIREQGVAPVRVEATPEDKHPDPAAQTAAAPDR